jgi:hypothetical protein
MAGDAASEAQIERDRFIVAALLSLPSEADDG